MKFYAAVFLLFCMSSPVLAQSGSGMKGMVNLPTGWSTGIRGSAGVGFTDFTVLSPSSNFKLERGTYYAVAIERGFDFANLYFTLTLSQMSAQGVANYTYRNFSGSSNYSATDVNFDASLLDIALGLKWRLIDNYWFQPYVEAGGVGSYDTINYRSKFSVLDAQGGDWKKTDIIMGSGYYTEGGIEVQFTNRFGIKVGGRFSEETTKELDTQGGVKLKFRSETYYFAAAFGF